MPLLNSSHLHAADYSPAGTLTIHFKDGSAYAYHGVPRATYTSLLSAKSPGQFFHRQLQGKFKHSRLAKPNRGS